ncbi:DUF3431 domain-containing protein [Polynucleobacter sp. AP-RePozz3-80-G7]|uniref:DUF3431 domain-containing protein n=1 Tax=Polynucleobacter sp. AP-RePozz3-80-G7 TaxID=2689105 RepID=UPI001C0E7731|nr:DUF3431 domain-containing protein [Polynucleobacter sp. AP-RePozz3-80-G7]MBU3638544.1 DUF3431 domain-containing protein [Polynucleobacter sp. AP-RePozz3-80-G7]
MINKIEKYNNKSKIFFVISNYNTDPEKFLEYCKDYHIYDQSDDLKIKSNLNSKYSKITFVENSGHSITNYFRYFIENYTNLPDCIALLKANMIGRHISEECFDHVINNQFYTALYSDRNWVDRPGIAYQLHDGAFLEINNNWYAGSKSYKYFRTYNQLLSFIFVNPIIPNWLLFSPGACYIVTREQILNYPKEFYENLKYIVSYQFFPAEAYHIERMLGVIFNGYYKLQPYMLNRADFEIEMKKIEAFQMRSCAEKYSIFVLWRRLKASLKYKYNLFLYKLILKNNN